MRYIYLVLSLLTIAGFAMPSAQAQWLQTNGPWTGSYLPSVFVDGETVLAGTQYGVYRSTDGGFTWQPPLFGEPFGTVLSFAANGNVYFAGTAMEGIFRSADYGRTWSAINRGLHDLHVRDIAVSPDGKLLFAGTNSGVFRSTDNGTTWDTASTGLTNLGIRCLLIRSDGNMMYAGTSKGLFRSTDLGLAWSPVDGGIDSYVESMAYSGDILIGVTLRGVYRSTNEGAHWTQPTLGLPATNAYDIAVAGAMIFIATPKGVFTSKDGGVRWAEVNAGLPDAAVFRVFAIGTASEGMLFAGTDGGVFRADLWDLHWHSANAGLPTVSMLSLASLDGDVYAGTHGWGVFRSSDDGDAWSPATTGLRSAYVRCLSPLGPYLFAGTAGGVQRSSNRGITWDTLSGEGLLAGSQCFAIGKHPHENRARIFTGTGQGAYYSDDNGDTWTVCNLGEGIFNISTLVAPAKPGGGSVVFAGTPNGGMYVSTDGGDSWESRNEGLGLHSIVSLAADSLYVYAGTTNGVYRTRVNSRTFSWVHTGLDETVVLSMVTLPNGVGGSHIFAGTVRGGLRYSSNRGQSWKEVGDELRHSDVIALASSGDYLYAGTLSQAVWRRPLDEMIEAEPPGPGSSRLMLHQNYPNPYSPHDGVPHTVIDYEVPQAAFVTLKVYNMSGQEVATVVEEMNSEGLHTSTLDASRFPAGSYIYRLSSNGQVVNKMMMVVR